MKWKDSKSNSVPASSRSRRQRRRLLWTNTRCSPSACSLPVLTNKDLLIRTISSFITNNYHLHIPILGCESWVLCVASAAFEICEWFIQVHLIKAKYEGYLFCSVHMCYIALHTQFVYFKGNNYNICNASFVISLL